MKQKIQIDGKEFYLDVSKARVNGFLSEKPDNPPLKAGDVYKSGTAWVVVIEQYANGDRKYGLSGYASNAFVAYSSGGTHGLSIQDMERYLDSGGYKYCGNIKDDVRDIARKLANNVVA